ncbi:restriction endonuclease fold toxin [Paenibacillus sp. FSL R7-0204]|uniref:RHS repeat-associated core domain-containing protein n=1 Tax=Paenibacillus sp. FSL R7-0204 TaxID=2921675 RepID=UPI0030F617A7
MKKACIRISLASFILMMFFLPAASAETLQDQLNNLVGPKQKYNTMLSPAYLRTNETIDEISPQSGSLTITQTDYVLPGKNGLDLEFKRIYKNETANVQEMEVNYVDGAWVDRAFSYAKTSSFYEDRYNLGMGMRFSFPNIEVKVNSDGSSHKFLHTDSGDVYRLKPANLDGAYVFLPEGQTVKDVVVRETAAYQNGQADGTSKYVMTGKDGKNTYFAEDGRILGIVDRYGNTINFQYESLSYYMDGHSINKKLISKITDSVGRDTTIEYKEDFNYTVGPISIDSPVNANNYYNASQSPNNTDSGDLKGKFQVIVHLPGDKSIVYDKSAALVNDSKHVIRTRLQRVYDTDAKPKFMFWYEQPDLGFTYFNKDKYSAYSRYENLVLVDEVKSNKAKSYVYNTYTKRLNEGSMQYRKIFESKDLIKKGLDPAKPNFLDKFVTDTYNKQTYTYTNEADGYGTVDYKQDDKAYLKDTYRYYTTITDVNGSTVKYTYNGNQEMILTEKLGKNHKETVTSEHDELKLVKKQETLIYQVAGGQATGEPVHSIENYRYDEYGNMTSHTGPIADRDSKGYPVNNEHTELFTYDINKYHILTQKTWKLNPNTTAQTNYELDSKGNVIKESKATNDPANPWLITDYAYDSYGNLIRKTAHDRSQDFTTHYEYGIDANGTNTKGAYLTKQYQQADGKTYAKTYAYDMQTGNIVSEIDANGNKTSYQYDAVGRVLKNIRPDNKALQYEYQESPYANFKIQYTDAGNYKYLNEYDIEGNLLNHSINSQGTWERLSSLQYDAFGNLTKEMNSNGHSTRYTYDSNQQIVEKSFYDNDKALRAAVKIDYQINSSPQFPMLMTITNEEGYGKRYYYDLESQLIKQEVTPDRQTYYASTFTYDYVGNLITDTDEGKHTTLYTYDALGRKISATDALGNTTEYGYNAMEQPVSEKAPGGKITEWIYDGLGRNTIQKIYQAGTSDYFYTNSQYDAVNNRIKLTQGLYSAGANKDSSITSFSYDSLNQVTDQYVSLDAANRSHTSNEYDANGNKTKTVEYADSTGAKQIVQNYQYDFAGNITSETGSSKEKGEDGSLVERGAYQTLNEFDLEGNLLKTRRFNGTGYDTEENTYNYRNLKVSSSKPFNDKGPRISRYQYDKSGNLIAETSVIDGTERTTSYTYDGLGFATGTTDPLGNSSRYQYDTMGNLLKTVDSRYSALAMEQAPGIENIYDAENRLIKTIAFDGTNREVIAYKEYDGRGNLIKDVDGEGYNATHPEQSIGLLYQYNVVDKPVEIISAQAAYDNKQQGIGKIGKQLIYDGSGNVLSETDELGHTTSYLYDLGGRLKQTTYADGSRTTVDYDLTGKWVTINTDKSGQQTKSYNTIFGSPYLIEYPDGTSESFRYSSQGELLESTDQNGKSIYYGYDLAGNQISKKEYIRADQTNTYYRFTLMKYDEAAKLLSTETFQLIVSNKNGAVTQTSMGDLTQQIYDKGGRVIQVTGPFGRESKQDYDRAGNVITTYQKSSDNNYDITRNSYDSRSRLTKSALLVKTADISAGFLPGAIFDNEYVDRLEAATTYTYSKNDQLLSQSDAKGNTTSFEYNYNKQLLKKTDAMKGSTLYQYDAAGNVLTETNSIGMQTRYEYDALDRVLRKSLPAADGGLAVTRYIYDLSGNLIREISPNQYKKELDSTNQVLSMKGMSYTYDKMNRRLSTVSPEGTVVEYLEYDAKGQMSKKVDGLRYSGNIGSSKGITYLYDGLGRLIKETNVLGDSKRYEYDVLDHLLARTDERGNTTSYEVNPDGTPAKIIYADGGIFKYTFDKQGRKTSETNPLGAVTTTSYTSFGKEKVVKDPYGYTVENKYDLNGNLVSVKDQADSITLFNYDAGNRLIDKKSPLALDESRNVIYAVESFHYDAAGNMTKKIVLGSKEDSANRETTYIYFDNNLLKGIIDNSGASSSMEYDKNGNLIKSEKLRDSDLKDVEQYEYDSQNRMVKRIGWLDKTTVEGYSTLPNLADLLDSSYPNKIMQITTYSYDVLGNKIQETDPRANGFLSSDSANRKAYTINYTYDAMNRVEKVIRALGSTESVRQYSYDAAGNKISDKDERGYVTKYAYDPVNRITVVTDPEGNKFTTAYDLAGNKIADTNAKGYSMSYTYDKLNRVSLTIDPYGTVVGKKIYDAKGNMVKSIDAKGYAAGETDGSRYGITYHYDLGNRVTAAIDPVLASKNGTSKFTTVYQYNIYGNLIQKTDALGNSIRYEYDNAGRLTQVTDALGVEVSYSYDRMGNKQSMKDGRGKVTQYRYGSFGVLQSVTDAGNATISYTYDLALNKQRMIDRQGNSTLYLYSNQNLLTEMRVVETGDKINFSYDEAGNRTGMNDVSGTYSYTYNSQNQLLQISKDSKVQIKYTYDVIGNVESVTDILGYTTTYQYDKSSRMARVDYDGKETAYSYDKNGNRTMVQYEDGLKEVYTYDLNNRLLTLTNKRNNGSEISSYRYTYDDAGRQITKTDSFGSTAYSYDDAGRIKQVEAPGKTTVYAYDRAGNRQSMLETYTSLQPSSYIFPDTKQALQYKLKKSEYQYSSSNQLMKLEERMSDTTGKELLLKTVDYLFDKNGNELSQRTAYTQPHTTAMHQSTGGDTYEAQTKEINSLIEKVTQVYDGFNRLTKAVKVKAGDRTTVDYVYNGDGLRVKKTVSSAKAGNIAKETNYVYDRQHVILEMDGGSKLSARYIRGINYIARMNQAKAYTYYLFNGHGDVVQTVTSAGEVQNQYDYDVFGNPVLSIESYSESIRYAGEYYDGETGLYYLRARYYDPYIGRFLSEDSYWGEDNNPLSLNLYTYANNDPIQYIDPTGHKATASSIQSQINRNDAAADRQEHLFLAKQKASTPPPKQEPPAPTKPAQNSKKSASSAPANNNKATPPATVTKPPATSNSGSTSSSRPSASGSAAAAAISKLQQKNTVLAVDLKKAKKEEQVVQAAKTSVKKDPVPVKSSAKNTASGSVFNSIKNGTKNLVVNTYNLMIGDDAKLAFGKDKSFLQRSAGSANLLLNVATFGEAAFVKSSVKGAIQVTEKIAAKITGKAVTSAVVKDAAEIAGSKAIQKAAQQTSAAVGNQTVQEMLSNSPSGLYSKLRKQGIPTTLTDDEVKAANSAGLKMQAEGAGKAGRYSGDLVVVNKPDAAADALAERIGGQSRVKFSNDPASREFDAINDQYVGQSKPALHTVNKSVRDQMKATFEAAQETGRRVYYHFEGQPAQSVIDKLNEYSSRYGIKVLIDTKPLK